MTKRTDVESVFRGTFGWRPKFVKATESILKMANVMQLNPFITRSHSASDRETTGCMHLMEPRRNCLGLLCLLLYLSTPVTFITQCEAKRRKGGVLKAYRKKTSSSKDGMNPPYCVYPPPSTTTPPPAPVYYYFPPPAFLPPSPPQFGPSPPTYVPSPPEFVPGPPVFLPPVVYPPPIAPPPRPGSTLPALWCVAKPTVPDPIIQEAMDYACGSGADCESIQPSGSCYQPDTLLAHASYAFNSYWQRTKVVGGTCDFGGTAMLVTTDPSYGGCNFSIM